MTGLSRSKCFVAVMAWVAEGRLISKRCKGCSLKLSVPIRIEAPTRTEVRRKLEREALRVFVGIEMSTSRGPERADGQGGLPVHELAKMKIGRLKSMSEYDPVPEAAVSGGRLDMAYVSRVSREIVAAFEIESRIKPKSIRKLASLPDYVLKVLVTTSPESDPRVRGDLVRFREQLEWQGILHVRLRFRHE